MKSEQAAFILPKSQIWKVFDDISTRYDLLNRLLSFGFDIGWRKKIKEFLPPKSQLKILDLATGTADVLINLCAGNPNIQEAFGIDLAEKMLEIGKKKIQKKGLTSKIHLQPGDCHQIPFAENTFDCTTIAFGIRNMENPSQVLKEMFRVLKKDGRALILEFSLPQNIFLRNIYLFYLRNAVPVVGGLLSGHFKAYRYLNQTVEDFPYGQAFCRLIKDEGFQNVRGHSLMAGVAAIYCGEKI